MLAPVLNTGSTDGKRRPTEPPVALNRVYRSKEREKEVVKVSQEKSTHRVSDIEADVGESRPAALGPGLAGGERPGVGNHACPDWLFKPHLRNSTHLQASSSTLSIDTLPSPRPGPFARRSRPLFSLILPFRISRHHVLQVRLHQGPEGAALPFLPDFAAERPHEVCFFLECGAPDEYQADSLYRSFLQRAYPTMKKHNPHTPIMMREAAGTLPRVYARYGTHWRHWRLDRIGLVKSEANIFRGTALGQEKQEALSGEPFTNHDRGWKMLTQGRPDGSANRGENHQVGERSE